MTRFTRFLTGVVFLIVPTATNANESTNSEVWLDYAQDEQGALDYSLQFYLGLGQDDSLLLSLGQTESEVLGRNIETNSYLIGYSTFGAAPWTSSLVYEYWGKSREMIVQSLSLDLGYLANEWDAGLELDYRQIDLYTRTLSSGQRRFDVDSYGIGFNTAIIKGRLRWSLLGKWYTYSEDLRIFNTARGLFIFGLNNFDHVGSLNKWNAASYVTYRFNNWQLGIGYSYAVAELDDAPTSSLAFLVDIDVTKKVSVSMEIGSTFEQQDVNTEYLVWGLGFRF